MYQPREKKQSKLNSVRAFTLAALVLVTVLSLATFSAAQDQGVKPLYNISQFKGNWAGFIVGNTGCGITSMYLTFTLDATGQGNGTVTTVGHSAACGDNTSSGNNFNVTAYNANGSGTATLSCGSGCGWTFTIQMSRNGQLLSLVDVYPGNPNNFLGGTAMKQ